MPNTRRILYVDDDAGLRRLAQRELERHGFTVVPAATGDEALEHVREGGFAAVCLDHYMPGLDGMQTLEHIHAIPDAPPVIFVTGAEDGRIAVAALRAGAIDYVFKEAGPHFMALISLALEDAIARNAMKRAKEQAEATLREALARAEDLAQQRALLLRECNHRVANSLQILASLTRLQEAGLEDGPAKDALLAIHNRIAAVAQVHRRLYTSDDVSRIALHEYLGGLVEELGRATAGVRLTLEAEPMTVLTDRAVSLGLIVNELVTNALKYAYPDGRSGAVRVRLSRQEDQGRIAVEDDGVGSDPHALGGTGLGRRVVEAMAMKLGGGVAQRRGARGGTTVEVWFALD